MYQVMVQNWPQSVDDGKKSSNKSLCLANFAYSGLKKVSLGCPGILHDCIFSVIVSGGSAVCL